MAIPFSRTMRAVQADRFGRSALLLGGGTALLLAWSGWLVGGRVTLYAVAESARLEVDLAAHAIEAPVSGQITRVHAVLEQPIEAGAVLFELDADAERLRLREAAAHLDALVAQRRALVQQAEAGNRALGLGSLAGSAAVEEAEARVREMEAAATLAAADQERQQALFDSRIISRAEYERTAALALQTRAAAEAAQQALNRTRVGEQRDVSDRRGDLDALNRELARLAGEIATTEATMAQLEHEIARRSVTTPISGHVGDLAELRVGSFVTAGDRLGSVIPRGQLRAIARFHPSTAMGRVAPGQPAKLRLDGFPSTQYGSVAGVVSKVAAELQEGMMRVELELRPTDEVRIPLQHGLPGSAEIEVERVSPVALVLRQTGKLLQAR